MPGNHDAKIDQFLKSAGLDQLLEKPIVTVLRNNIERAIAARAEGNAATEKSELSDAFEAIDTIQDQLASDAQKTKLKKAVGKLVQNLGKPAKSRGKFNLGAALAKNKPKFMKAFGFAKKGKKKETDAAVADLHRSMRATGELPNNVTLDQFYTGLGKYQAVFNKIRKEQPDGEMTVRELQASIKEILSKEKFTKARKEFGIPASPKVFKDIQKAAQSILRVGVNSSETKLYCSEIILNYADIKKMKGDKKDSLRLAQRIHDEMHMAFKFANIDEHI